MRFAVLSREHAAFGIALLEALAQRGLRPCALGLERTTWAGRWRLARGLARRTGLANAAWHNGRIWSRVLLARPRPYPYRERAERVLVVPEINHPAMVAFLAEARPDLLVLGQPGLLREPLLAIPSLGTLNAHPGLLPWYRGVDVVRWALWLGGPLGVTLHYVDAGVDRGPVIASRPLPVAGARGPGEVEARANRLALELLVEGVARFAAGEAPEGRPQPAGAGRQYHLMPPWTAWRLRRQWPRLRERLAASPAKTPGLGDLA